MRGPGQRLDLDVRRVWRCPRCGRERRLAGEITTVRCECPGGPTWMELVNERTVMPRPMGSITTPEQTVESFALTEEELAKPLTGRVRHRPPGRFVADGPGRGESGKPGDGPGRNHGPARAEDSGRSEGGPRPEGHGDGANRSGSGPRGIRKGPGSRPPEGPPDAVPPPHGDAEPSAESVTAEPTEQLPRQRMGRGRDGAGPPPGERDRSGRRGSGPSARGSGPGLVSGDSASSPARVTEALPSGPITEPPSAGSAPPAISPGDVRPAVPPPTDDDFGAGLQ